MQLVTTNNSKRKNNDAEGNASVENPDCSHNRKKVKFVSPCETKIKKAGKENDEFCTGLDFHAHPLGVKPLGNFSTYILSYHFSFFRIFQ
eukprot:Pgem_evm2s16329